MDIKKLKRIIFEQNKVEYILNDIGCKDIVRHDTYYSCANYNGDNRTAINQYFDTEYLNCINYTRDIRYNTKLNNPTSIIDLICYNKKINLFQCANYLCEILGVDYYSLQNNGDLPESLKLLQMLEDMSCGDYDEEENKPLKPISEKILTYYKPYVNLMFYRDNISYDIQKEFEVGYDDSTNCITIPIRDELGNLVGVKGRYLDETLKENKYVYIEKCARRKILYGLYKSYKYIKQKGIVYIGESEKFTMQMFSMGYYNCISTCGKKISKNQKMKIASLGVDIVFCFDKDVQKEELINLSEDFIGANIYMIYDKDNILNEKESPTDNKDKWEILLKTSIIKIKGGESIAKL